MSGRFLSATPRLRQSSVLAIAAETALARDNEAGGPDAVRDDGRGVLVIVPELRAEHTPLPHHRVMTPEAQPGRQLLTVPADRQMRGDPTADGAQRARAGTGTRRCIRGCLRWQSWTWTVVGEPQLSSRCLLVVSHDSP